MEPFTLSLDSLLAFDGIHLQSIYICVAFVLFSIGLFNNICSFATFQRSRPREFGVGNCLFVVTILNQCSLLFLLIKFIQILVGSSVGWTNDALCKILSYFLAVSTRSTNWLTSWVTVDRLLMILFPNVQAITKPRAAILSSLIILFLLLIMHIHEILFSTSIYYPESTVSLCVTDFARQSTAIDYNRVSALLHHLVPFFIQVISITFLIILVARQRMKTLGSKTTFKQLLKNQFSTQKELYATPSVIVLSALPQSILSFSLTCKELNDWQRHILLVTYILSYTPQMLGFLLYVIPSSAYTKEFKDTSIYKTFSRNRIQKRTTKTTYSDDLLHQEK